MDIASYYIANVALQVFASAMLIIIIICQLESPYRNIKSNQIFLSILFMSTAILVCDAFAWAFDNTSGRILYMLLYASNYSIYVLGFFIMANLLMYIVVNIPLDKNIERKITLFCIIMTIMVLTFYILLQKKSFVFYIDENNLFVKGIYYWIPDLIFGIQLLIIIFFILYFRNMLTYRSMIAFLSYPLILVIGLLINMLYHYLMTGHISLALSLLIMFVNIQIQKEKDLMEKEVELIEKEAELTENRMSIMLSQIQPHFLYNSLSAISDLCYDNPKAQKALLSFAAYLRANMDSLSENKLVAFEKELEHVRHYIWLESLRFEERLKVIYDIKVNDFMIPALTLQPIVENAIRYGVTKRRSGGTITIQTEETNNDFHIIVIDDGIGFDTEKFLNNDRSHTGILNVQTRLSVMCGGVLTIRSFIGSGTVVTIEIPKKR